MAIHDHDTLRAMNRALAEKYGTKQTAAAIDRALGVYQASSIGYLSIGVLDGVYKHTVDCLERQGGAVR